MSVGRIRGEKHGDQVWHYAGGVYSFVASHVARTPEELYRECQTVLTDLQHKHPELGKAQAKQFHDAMPRIAQARKCTCEGYCERVKTTFKERQLYGCSNEKKNKECCARAFICHLCGTRWVGKADSPESEK